MRWLKHMTATRQDEKVAAFVSKCGHEGYGFYWMLLETVAAQIEKGSDNCSVTYPLTTWSRLLYCHHNRVSKYLSHLEVVGLVTVKWGSSDITVKIPKLLKYRDEYTSRIGRMSGESPDQEQIQIQKQNTDTETTPPNPPNGGLSKVPSTRKRDKRKTPEITKALGTVRFAWWKDFWAIYPCHEDPRSAMDAFERTVLTVEDWAKVRAGAVRYRQKADSDPDLKLKYGQGWINGERWADENARARAPAHSKADEVEALMQRRIDEGWQHP